MHNMTAECSLDGRWNPAIPDCKGPQNAYTFVEIVCFALLVFNR